MDIQSAHTTLIILHATAATLAFFAGCLLIFSPAYLLNQQLFNLYQWTLIAMLLLLAGAILVYWKEYSDVERIIFPGLLGLALFMLFRAWGAGLVLATQQDNWKLGYVEHIGFTLISLFEGFIIVGGLDLGIPVWLVAIVAILGLLAGRWLIGMAKQRIAYKEYKIDRTS
jgi:hypothetical protein